jgi:DNA-binding transcriptional LysR family regulator
VGQVVHKKSDALEKLSVACMRVVRAAAKHKNLTHAARALGISQPAVSQQLAKFEKTLGYPVLVRKGNSLLINDQETVETLDRILDGIEALKAKQEGFGSGKNISLGLSPLVSETLVQNSKLYLSLADQYNIVAASTDELSKMFNDGIIDMVFRPIASGEQATELIMDGHLVWVRGANSKLGDEATPQQPLRVILPPQNTICGNLVEGYLKKKSVDYSVTARAIPSRFSRLLVEQSLGITPIPPFGVQGNAIAVEPSLGVVENFQHGFFYNKKVVSHSKALDIFMLISDFLEEMSNASSRKL